MSAASGSMSGCMARRPAPGFWGGVGIAIVACLIAVITNTVFAPLLSGAVRLQLLISLLSLFYLSWLAYRSPRRNGRIFAMVCAVAMLLLLVWLPLSWFALLLAHTVLISVLRTLLYHRTVMAGLLDLALSTLAQVALLWAWQASHSLLLGVWSYFLVHSLFALIPARFPDSSSFSKSGVNAATHTWTQAAEQSAAADIPVQRFEQAYQQAQDAYQQLAGQSRAARYWRV